MIVAVTGPFDATGGWALAGEQAIRYTGLGAGTLTGIPATGPGAVVGPIQYNTSIRSAPILTGIPASGTRSLPIPLNAGDEVYAVVQVDDDARQAQLATDLGVPSGIREEWISDRRLSIPEARARGQATLLSRPLVDGTVEYTCRDPKTAGGLTIHVDLPAPTNVAGDYKIQSVTWSNFRPRPEQPPTARVTASSRRFRLKTCCGSSRRRTTMPITRTAIVDDDGSGTTGTVIDNAWKQEFYNQIDASEGGAAPTVLRPFTPVDLARAADGARCGRHVR